MRTIEEVRQEASVPPPPLTTRKTRGPWYAALAILAVAAVVAALFVFARDDDPSPSGSTDTTQQTTPTTAPPPTTAPQARENTAVWPLAGSGETFTTPREAAESYAVDFLGFKDPIVGEFQQGDSRSGEVGIRPIATGPVTTVLVRQLSGDETWSVLGSATANIEVTSPEALDLISSPVTVSGRALAFEGNVNVHIRTDDGGVIGEGFVTGGGDVMRPFTGTIAFETPGSPFGSLVFATYSAKDGSLWEAASFRIEFGESTDDLRAALETLLRGPNHTEDDSDVDSFFSSETAGLLRSVNIIDGHAVVDFGDLRTVIPNASSSAGSARLLAELDTTVFQFSSVKSAEYRIDGSCEAFSEWLQYGGCEPRTRGTSED